MIPLEVVLLGMAFGIYLLVGAFVVGLTDELSGEQERIAAMIAVSVMWPVTLVVLALIYTVTWLRKAGRATGKILKNGGRRETTPKPKRKRKAGRKTQGKKKSKARQRPLIPPAPPTIAEATPEASEVSGKTDNDPEVTVLGTEVSMQSLRKSDGV